ncbi:MAG: alkaline phosphatase family protein [Longimicrobiales bacterium]
MRRSSVSCGFLALALVLTGAPAPLTAQQADGGPRLVVLISVDQLRGDLLERFAPAFDGGLARFLKQGYRFPGASHAHAGTYTAAGHATLATGVFPSRSGIVANSWNERTPAGWRPGVYAVEDVDSPLLGVQGAEGRSPKNLLTTGLADWIQASDPDSRVVSLSGKDRAAVTMAGKARGHVYWVERDLARFVTSTYYRDEYPGWVEAFNETEMPALLAAQEWTSSVPAAHAGLARPDEGLGYEGDGVRTTFPHRAADETVAGNPASFNTWAMSQPRIDAAVRRLAEVAVQELELGQRGSVDYLGLSFSAADYVGHGFGPLSLEQMDNLLRLDQELGQFLEFLDREVGRGQWVAGLSADHGVVTMPEVQGREGEGGFRVDPAARQAALAKALQDAAAEVGQDAPELPARLARMLVDRGLVAGAYTHDELAAGLPADSFAVLFRNSHYPGRAAGPLSRFGVEIRSDNHDLWSGPLGTTHGSPYWYDRSVPFILLGAGVSAGSSDRGVYTVDMAPTLGALAGIPVPNDRDGRSVYR